jgi:hypothetical protein
LKPKKCPTLRGTHYEAYQKVLKSGGTLAFIMTTAKTRLVSVSKSYLDSLEATIETLENEYVMDQLEKSELDIRKGRVRSVREFLKELQ